MIDQQTFEIMSSPTLGKLAKFAEDAPWDVNDKGDLNSAMFHGLLSVNLAQFFDGKVRTEAITRQ